MTDAAGRTPIRPSDGRRGRNLLVILGVSLLAIGIFVAVAEVYLRFTVPFVATHWPARFDPRFGITFQPGEVLQWTNGVDFWTRTRANALGFLDREPPAGPAPGGCRVLFIGDSFVEAAQVPIDNKFHVVFEQLAREQIPALDIETLAFGYSGTGQANQLAFYEFFGAPLQPDVVVLVVAPNDFANNSPLLESARYGWHPLHLPRLYFAVAPDGERLSRQPIDPDWERHQLAYATAALRPLHSFFHEYSYFYNWLFAHLQARLPAVAARLSGRSKTGFVTARLRDIERIDGFSQAFAHWDYPDDLDMDRMFFAQDPLPPVFGQALRLSGHALDAFRRRGHSDGFRLLLLATHGLSENIEPGTVQRGRTLQNRGYLQRLMALAIARGIPLIDQYEFIVAQGGDPGKARFSRDVHWSEQGHNWAAGAVLEYFHRNPQVCSANEQL